VGGCLLAFHAHAAPNLSDIQLPPGFSISLFATDIAQARSMTLGANGTVFVGTRTVGRVYALVDADHDGQAEQTYIIASGLDSPNGVAFYNGALYVAEVSRIIRFDNIESRLANPPAPVTVYDALPTDQAHGWKYLRIGSDGYLYFGIGAPCNICLSDDPIYATLARVHPDGTQFEIVAHGVRNTVGFDWSPETGNLWFTDNGRDAMGDNIPPDELNAITQPGLHYGYPYYHASIPDPIFGDLRPISDFVLPVKELGPHVAALGMRFYTGGMFPAQYQNQIFIAEHGSMDRSSKVGYRLTLVTLDSHQNPIAYEPFAQGWLRPDQTFTGRPVDVLILNDGSMLVSDDHANSIYRITYKAPAPMSTTTFSLVAVEAVCLLFIAILILCASNHEYCGFNDDDAESHVAPQG